MSLQSRAPGWAPSRCKPPTTSSALSQRRISSGVSRPTGAGSVRDASRRQPSSSRVPALRRRARHRLHRGRSTLHAALRLRRLPSRRGRGRVLGSLSRVLQPGGRDERARPNPFGLTAFSSLAASVVPGASKAPVPGAGAVAAVQGTRIATGVPAAVATQKTGRANAARHARGRAPDSASSPSEQGAEALAPGACSGDEAEDSARRWGTQRPSAPCRIGRALGCCLTPEAATPARLLVRAESGSVDETAAWATKGKRPRGRGSRLGIWPIPTVRLGPDPAGVGLSVRCRQRGVARPASAGAG